MALIMKTPNCVFLTKNRSVLFNLQSLLNTAVNHESFLNGTSATYLEDMYRLWQADPKQVHPSWDVYFRGVNSGRPVGSAYVSPLNLSGSHDRTKQAVAVPSLVSAPATRVPTQEPATSSGALVDEKTIKEYLELQSIIQSFRIRGHMAATLDPLNIIRGEHLKAKRMQQYVLRHYKLPKDMSKTYLLHNSDFIGGGEKYLPVTEILKRLETAYCGNVGVEYMHLQDQEKYEFIRRRFETPGTLNSLTSDEKRLILKRLIRANNFEEYLSKKYPSEKRFGLEGGEVLIPAVKTMIDTASSNGVDIFNIGIAHRGRLNILANVVRKPLPDIFAQFLKLEMDDLGSGDVKYHLGTYVERINSQTQRPIIVSVTANPSHLESVCPVVVGKTYGERVMMGDKAGKKVWSILIHGDAATSGQGIIYETFHLSELPCFTNHGSIHIIINNQIGFTTDPRVARSSEYCTEVAKVSNAPVFHVNGDDPEAVCYVMKVATEYKLKFHSDVVVDIVCYRRHGHSEADQPKFTQPLMYKVIESLKPVSVKYKETLIAQGIVNEGDIKEMEEYSSNWLHKGFEDAQKIKVSKKRDWLDSPWKKFFKPEKDLLEMPMTGSSKEVLMKVGEAISTVPPNFELHPGLVRILKTRKDMMKKDSVDWSMGEAFAFGSLIQEGFNVRLTGQDVERGTFSQRHHVYHHQSQDQKTYQPLQNLFKDGGNYTVCNSSLSEFGVLGFEVGYSKVSPYNLVIWEAQFGDFSNSAQIMIDNFICSGEAKWGRQSGLVVLLPHGLEGQGPEHSSARPERYLQLCSEIGPPYVNDMPQQMLNANWFIANPTTPANFFHVLRRQLKLNFRKPLIIFSPKSLLRHPEAKSSIDEMVGTTMFKPYLQDTSIKKPGKVEKVLFCCGKVYYELKEERKKRKLEDKVAICRIEQLFPFPYGEVCEDLQLYAEAEICWAQEEHRNQGWWSFVEPRLTSLCSRGDINYCGRPSAAAPSTGSKQIHVQESADFMNQCFTLNS